VARVTLITGQIQTGKTTLALELLRREAVRGLILDPVRSKPFNGLAPSYDTWPKLARFLGSDDAKGRWLVCFRSMEATDYQWTLAAAPYYRHVTLLVDEGLWFSQDQELLEPLVKCCRMNAHFGGGEGVEPTGMPLLITAQRPNDLPVDIRSQADRWISFRQEEPRDLEYFESRCSPDFAAGVAALGPHQWLLYPPTTPQRTGQEHASREGGSGVRARGSCGPRAFAHDPAVERDPQAAGPDGRRHDVSLTEA
jgi:hypothetical protein